MGSSEGFFFQIPHRTTQLLTPETCITVYAVLKVKKHTIPCQYRNNLSYTTCEENERKIYRQQLREDIKLYLQNSMKLQLKYI